MKRRFLTLALAAAALTAACGDDNGPQGQGRLRVVHLSPDSPPVDVVLDGDTVVRGLVYRDASEYLDASAGSHTLQVSAAGTTTTLLDQDISVTDGADYTVMVANLAVALETIVLTDDNNPPPAGKIKVRAVHASPGAGRVDVYVTTPDDVLTGAVPALIDVRFGQFSNYLDADAGTYRVRVTVTGTTDLLIDSGGLTLDPGQVRTVIAVDAEGGGGPFDLVLLADRD